MLIFSECVLTSTGLTYYRFTRQEDIRSEITLFFNHLRNHTPSHQGHLHDRHLCCSARHLQKMTFTTVVESNDLDVFRYAISQLLQLLASGKHHHVTGTGKYFEIHPWLKSPFQQELFNTLVPLCPGEGIGHQKGIIRKTLLIESIDIGSVAVIRGKVVFRPSNKGNAFCPMDIDTVLKDSHYPTVGIKRYIGKSLTLQTQGNTGQ